MAHVFRLPVVTATAVPCRRPRQVRLVAGDCSVTKLPYWSSPSTSGTRRQGCAVGIRRNGDRGSIRTKVNKDGIVLVCCDGCSIAQLSGVVAPQHVSEPLSNGTGMVRPDVEGHRRSACAEINGR